MVLYFLIGTLLVVLSAIFSIFGLVSQLPFGMDANLVWFFGIWNSFLEDFWPLVFPWTCLFWYITFEALLVLAKFFFGARVK